nr:M20 family metallopeptidase [Brevibacterium daeguense]
MPRAEAPVPATADGEPIVNLTSLADLNEIVDLTCSLVACDSTNPGGTEDSTVEVIVDFARHAGLLVHVAEVAPGRPNVVVTLPATFAGPAGPDAGEAGGASGAGNGPGLLFLGHSDVVPAGDGWGGDPFAPRVEEGRVTGRGTADMKGALAVVLCVMAGLAEAVAGGHVELSGPVSLAVTVDEEETGIGIRHLVVGRREGDGRGDEGRDGAGDVAGVDETRALRGRLGPHAGTEFLGCVVAEPTELEVVRACRGDSYIDFTITGKPAHSGRPGDGINAITAAAGVIAEIERDNQRLAQEPDTVLGAATWSPGLISGGTGTSIVAGECFLSVDRRLLPGEDVRGVAAMMTARLLPHMPPGVEVSASVPMAMPGFITAEDDPLVTAAAQAVTSALGRPAEVSAWSASCDGGFIAERFGIPVIVCGPGSVNDEAHQADESVGIRELEAAARAYTELIDTMLGAEHKS